MNSNSIRGKWILFGGVVILTAVAAGALAVWRQQNVKPAPKPAATQAPSPAGNEFTGNEVSLTGKVQAQQVIKVGVPIDGTIESFAVEAGQDVVEGQLLARIRNPRVDAALVGATEELDRAQTRVQNTEAAIIAGRLEASRARAESSRVQGEYDRAEKAYQRQKLLYAEGATPRLTYEKAESDYRSLKDENESKQAIAQQAEDRVEALNRDLVTFKKTLADRSEALEQATNDAASGDIHAPADGFVVSRRGEPGEAVTRDIEDLFGIATALSAMEVIVEPPPPQLQRIRAGQTASIHVAEAPNEVIAGTVREISGAQVIVDFISPTPLIKPGVSAQVTIKLT